MELRCLPPRITVAATNPSRGVVDFNDWRALQPIFDAAKLAGIFVVLRPGNPIPLVPNLMCNSHAAYRALRTASIRRHDSFQAILMLSSLQINAESTAGGIAHWITSEVAGELRTNATDWTAAYTPYVSGIIDAVVPNQVTEGGPILCM